MHFERLKVKYTFIRDVCIRIQQQIHTIVMRMILSSLMVTKYSIVPEDTRTHLHFNIVVFNAEWAVNVYLVIYPADAVFFY